MTAARIPARIALLWIVGILLLACEGSSPVPSPNAPTAVRTPPAIREILIRESDFGIEWRSATADTSAAIADCVSARSERAGAMCRAEPWIPMVIRSAVRPQST